MAAKCTTVLAALLAVLSSSTRRKPDYIRKQALVSLLYPYFFEDASRIIQGIYEAELIYIPPPPEVDVEDISLVDQFIYSAELKSTLIDYSFTEYSGIEQSIYSVTLLNILISYPLSENTIANQEIYSAAFQLIGLYLEPDIEISTVDQEIYSVYFGAP